MEVNGKTLVITGAASGIGRALAIEAMRRGASVALVDLELDAVLETKALAEQGATQHQHCSVQRLDVSRLEQWQLFREHVREQHGTVDGIINNAGVTLTGSVEAMSYDQLERVMAINFMGMVYGTKEFLPLLKSRPEALIANVSSVFGLFPKKDQSAYCASKYAIRGFTEVLHQELKDTQVIVSTIHPGHIGTDIARKARDSGNVVNVGLSDEQIESWLQAFKAHGMDPGKAAAIILDGVQEKRRRILVGDDAVRSDQLSRKDPEGFADASNTAAV